MTRVIRCVALGMGVFVGAIAGQPARADLLAVAADNNAIYRLSTTNAALTQIATPGVNNLGDIQRAPNGTLYGISYSAVPTPTLYRFDPTTLAAVAIGPLNIGFVFEGALAFTPTGTAYGATQGDAGTPRLFTINLTTGAATLGALITPGSHDINGMAFRGDGNLVALDDATNSLLVINPTTGAATTLAALPFTVGTVGGLTIDNGVGYFATGGSTGATNQLYSFNVSTGVSTSIGSFDPAITGGSGISGIATIPEPASLMAVALTGALVVRRRSRP